MYGFVVKSGIMEFMKNITIKELKQKIRAKEDFILLDVRTPEEFEEKSLSNAILLPLQEISQENLKRISLGDNKKEIVVYCRTGSRSVFACQILNNFGFNNVLNLEEGILDY